MKVKGFLYGLIASATFGLIPLFSIPALENGVGLDSLLFYRFSLASVLVAVLMWVKKIPFDIQKSEFGIAFILGTLYAITALWLTEAYLYIPSGVATTIHFLYPVVVSLIMFVFYKDKLTMPILLAMAMAVSGVYMLSGGNTPGGSINIKGLMLVLATVIAYAAYIVGMNRSRIARLDSLIVQHLLYRTKEIEGKGRDVGVIQLDPQDYALDEVVVKAERPFVKVEEGRLGYDLSVLAGDGVVNNAYEALTKLPGVKETKGVLTLAGTGNLTVVLNGKPTTMDAGQLETLLRNTPLDRVEKAEVMYSAPPEYHVR